MKKIFRTGPFIPKMITAVCLSVCLTFLIPAYASTNPETPDVMTEKDPGRKNVASKSKQTLKIASVKIYPGRLKKIIHGVAKENEEKEFDFYVFDRQGTLMVNNKMKAGNHIKIAGLPRGYYSYHVYSGEEETVSGNSSVI